MVLLHAKRRAAVATAPTKSPAYLKAAASNCALPGRSGSHETWLIALRAPRTSATFKDAFGAALVGSCLKLERAICRNTQPRRDSAKLSPISNCRPIGQGIALSCASLFFLYRKTIQKWR